MKTNYPWITALLTLALTSVAFAQGIDVKLEAARQHFAAEDPVQIMITVSNRSPEIVRMLNYHTPKNGLEGDILTLSLERNPVAYIGALYKRRTPIEEDYTKLAPGESLSGVVELWGSYDFAQGGRYAVTYKTELLTANRGNRAEANNNFSVVSNTIYLDIQAHELPIDPDDAKEDLAKGVSGENTFLWCSSGEKSDLATAREHALNYSINSYDDLASGNASSRYTTWFGSYDPARFWTVRNNFYKIRNAMKTEHFRFRCNCNQSGTYAWVFPWAPYRIHICPAFWSATMAGSYDSKAGVLLHEVSHFNVIAGTDDHAYGTTNAMNLAVNTPSDAIDNADNYEYFGENTPYSPYNPCGPTVTLWNGNVVSPYWDGSNCQVMQVPSGLTPFVWNNHYYVNAQPGTSCQSPSYFDGANCYIMPRPWWQPNYFIYAGNVYLTPGPGNSCAPPSSWDGAKCYVMPLPWGASPFFYANNLYVTPTPHCPIGSFDSAHCWVGAAPSGRNAFIWSGYFYYAHY